MNGSGIYGWPVLPHGGGTFYNVFGRYIGTIPTTLLGQTYAEYIPGNAQSLTGELLSCGINYENTSGRPYRVYMANYGTSVFSNTLVGVAAAGTNGSFEVSLANGFGNPILPTDYIGIYVEDTGGGSNIPPSITIEGTIYYSLF